MKDNLKEKLPKSKSDIEAAEELVRIGYPKVEPVLYELLEWCQDINWPVARIISPFLSSIGEPVLKEINRVLETDDDVWKYWCISEIVANMESRIVMKYIPELKKLALFPSDGERKEKVDLEAKEILEDHGELL